jgi:6-methylsalicylate decarboxylase
MPAGRIDVHAHYIPDVYWAALVAAGQARPDGIPAVPDWSEGVALEAMDRLEVRLAVAVGSHLLKPTVPILASR